MLIVADFGFLFFEMVCKSLWLVWSSGFDLSFAFSGLL